MLDISENSRIEAPLLQYLSIMIQNMDNEHAICKTCDARDLMLCGNVVKYGTQNPDDYCFSNGYINSIILHPYELDGGDLAPYYMSFLRAVSGKINRDTLCLLVNVHGIFVSLPVSSREHYLCDLWRWQSNMATFIENMAYILVIDVDNCKIDTLLTYLVPCCTRPRITPLKLPKSVNSRGIVTKEMTNGKSGHIKFSTNDPKDGRLLDNIESQTAKGTSSTNPFSQRFHSADKSNTKKTSKLMQASKVPQVINGEDTNNSSHTAETRSPRQRNEGFSKIRCQKRNFKHQVDVISSNVDSNRSMDSHRDIEGTQADHSESNNNISIQQVTHMNQNTATKELSKESAMAMITVTSEQQSPVSVLDLQFYSEDPPSPIKKKTEISKDLDEALATPDNIGHALDLPLSFNNTKANFSNGTSDDDLQTQNLDKVLWQNDDNGEKFTNCRERKDSDRKYIAEILLASGLLSSPSLIQAVHSPGHLINPKLFFALELLKTNKLQFNMKHNAGKILRINNLEEMQRKLIFDVVNEILVQKISALIYVYFG
ncbi:protein LONGIFOLIA 1-like [Arachis stenosperma]|uniref:protein LONGIFOLIA 1-like n=2 Tax=Arachis stenosperma TaxID=217475 RepID=UPI0025AC9A54|nr:protein LONGIFOLIA 1-like [Arachis stenosperma]